MSPAFRVYSTLTLLAAVLLAVTASWGIPGADPSTHWNALAAFVVLGLLSESSYFKLRVGRAETQSSVAFVPFFASFLLFDTGWVAIVAASSVLFSEAVIKRKATYRVVFNVSQVSVSIIVASLVFNALGGRPGLDHFRIYPVALGAAVAVYFGLNSAAVSLAVALDRGEFVWAAWARIAGASLVYDLFASLLAPLLAYLYIHWQIIGLISLILPLYFVRHLYNITLQLEQVNKDLLELMVKAIEARDPYTSGHSQRVAGLAEVLARELGLGAKQVEFISTAALLHDVGKIREEYAPLLRKEGKLDVTEKALMQTHSMKSAELVGTISAFRGSITDAVRHHHENYDGTGYPSGLAGKAIPIGARIIMIADTVDAMTTDRPYRKALSFERVTQELTRFAGRQFDPEIVQVFMHSAAIRDIVSRRAAESGDSIVPHRLPWRRFAKADYSRAI